MKSINRNIAVKYIIIVLLVVVFQGKAFAERYPDAITAFTGAASYCNGDVASPLSVTFSTCKAGNGIHTNIAVIWYSNSTNSASGGTQVAQTNSTTATTIFTYTPSTGTTGTLYYYVEISWAGGGSCNGPSPLSTSTFTPSTLEIIVNPPAPVQPGAITPSTPSPVPPSTGGLTYNISAVTDATSYTWTVPGGWIINSGQGTTSISVTSGTTGGNITVTADNSCGSSIPQTLAVTVLSNSCPESTSVTPTGIQTLCQGDASSLLTATITTSGGSGTPTLSYQWYYNTTNSNTVSGATLIAGATNSTYTPLTTALEIGDRWYFCVGYATDNGCAQTNADQSLASNAVQVSVNAPPTIASAGSPQTICDGISATLGANTPTAGTGAWSVVSGPSTNTSQFSSISDPAALFTPDGGAGSYVLRWTISNAPCTPSTSEVTITVNAQPTTSNAGSPQTICNGTGATLAANDPIFGTGAWSIVSGPSSNMSQFSSTTSNTATFTPDGGIGDYVLRWTISNDPCTPSTSEVTITVKDIPDLPVISGPATATTGNNYDYSITAVPDATNYTWTWPATWSIVSGQGTESITVTAGTQDGDVTVYVTNSCGDGPTATLTVTIAVASDCPVSTSVAPVTSQSHCQDDPAGQLTASVTTSGGTGTPTLLYQWYYNTTNSNTITGATLLSGATNSTYTPLTTASELGTRYYFCIGYASDNGCGQTNATQSLASNAVEVTVITTPVTPGTISGADNVSPSTSGLGYSISAVPTATSYNWTVPTGWSINSGQGTISISVTSGTEGQNGNISVTATNSCGTSAASTLAVTVTTAALPPTITLGANPTVCQSTTSADLPYTATTENPDQYSIDYFAASEVAGFIDVLNATLPISPISLAVPGAALAGTYYGNLTVRNSTSGLSSGDYTISVIIITTPATPATIFGNTTVPETTTGLSYAILAVTYATTYTWTVPTGWTITEGQGTTGIIVTSGAAGENGDVTVTAGNTCGTSAAATLSVVSEIPLDHSLYGCNACHITHNSPGGSLTSTFGNANLCLSCHVSTGAASGKPFINADKAIPGTSGNSHAWDVSSVNATYETVLTSDPEMVLRIDEGNIVCSTCHNQHNSNTNLSYTRISNAGDAMCKDCHSPRNVGRYVDNTSLFKGSHPVGLDYTGTGDFESVPTGSAILVGGKIECSSCHQTHYATSTDGYLLRQTNDDALCTSCHILGTHQGMGCKTCHQTHNTNKANIYMIRDIIATPNSNSKPVVFTALTGTNSFADGDGTYDGICEVCHTGTSYFRNDGNAPDQNHTANGGPMDGQNCIGCHPHNAAFAPQGCDDCHNSDAPTFASAVHVKHKDTYGYVCSTCHLNYGSGGSLEGTHPSGSININFDPSGMATRNGQDAITPIFNGDNTCDNVYCHSDGRSAYRGTDGTYTWSGTTGSQTAVYATTPVWGTGTITTCFPCHPGIGNMNPDYTITEPGPITSNTQFPATGSHAPMRNAHYTNSQNLQSPATAWTRVQCFWCHETDGNSPTGPKLQGTYGTSLHVDGQTHFKPTWFSNGGTIVNTMTYSFEGSAGHCGDGKTCW
ncbi:MAG: CxxxxCH/CxxCH domain-containing protein [Bacteroidales bacterium]|nr:CxxxxCH/CxxCH domain-containing protein [Bacteroidales bacterium]